MTSGAPPIAAPPPLRGLRRWSTPLAGLRLVAAFAAAITFGYLLVAVAAKFGDSAPLAVIGIVFVPVFLVVAFARPTFGFLGVILLAPVGVHQVPKTPFEVIQVAAAAAIVLTALRMLAEGEISMKFTGPVGWLVALCAWSVLSFPLAPDHGVAQRDVLVLVLAVILAATLAVVWRDAGDIRIALTGLVLMTGAVGFSSIVAGIRPQAFYGGSVVTGRSVGIFPEPNQFGTFCGVGALVAAALLFSAPTRLSRGLAAFGLLGSVVGLLLSLSRGAWIGFVLGVLVLLFTLRAARLALVLAGVPIVLLALAVGAFRPDNPQVQVVGERVSSLTGEKNPYDNRPAIWAQAISLTRQKPLLGWGPGSFPIESAQNTSQERPVFAAHAHNILLTFSAEDGVPAAILLVLLSVHLTVAVHRARKRATQRRRQADATMIAGLAAALVAVAGQGLVDYTIRNMVVLTSVAIVMGALFAMVTETGASPLRLGSPTTR